MSGTSATLYGVGAALELIGIILVSSPDLVPGTLRLVRWIRPRWRRIENRIRRLLGLPARGVTYEGSATVRLEMNLSAMGVVGIDPNASLEDKVAFLVRRHSETEQTINKLAQRVTAIETGTPKRVAELRAEMEAHVTRELAAAKEDYRFARISGAIVLAIGLALTTTANFVS